MDAAGLAILVKEIETARAVIRDAARWLIDRADGQSYRATA